MKKFLLLIFGLIFLGFAVSWYVTPLEKIVTTEVRRVVGVSEPAKPVAGPRSAQVPSSEDRNGPDGRPNAIPAARRDFLSLMLEGLNAIIGIVGIFMAWRSSRGGRREAA